MHLSDVLNSHGFFLIYWTRRKALTSPCWRQCLHLCQWPLCHQWLYNPYTALPSSCHSFLALWLWCLHRWQTSGSSPPIVTCPCFGPWCSVNKGDSSKLSSACQMHPPQLHEGPSLELDELNSCQILSACHLSSSISSPLPCLRGSSLFLPEAPNR